MKGPTAPPHFLDRRDRESDRAQAHRVMQDEEDAAEKQRLNKGCVSQVRPLMKGGYDS